MKVFDKNSRNENKIIGWAAKVQNTGGYSTVQWFFCTCTLHFSCVKLYRFSRPQKLSNWKYSSFYTCIFAPSLRFSHLKHYFLTAISKERGSLRHFLLDFLCLKSAIKDWNHFQSGKNNYNREKLKYNLLLFVSSTINKNHKISLDVHFEWANAKIHAIKKDNLSYAKSIIKGVQKIIQHFHAWKKLHKNRENPHVTTIFKPAPWGQNSEKCWGVSWISLVLTSFSYSSFAKVKQK